jgi:hypothetical protein
MAGLAMLLQDGQNIAIKSRRRRGGGFCWVPAIEKLPRASAATIAAMKSLVGMRRLVTHSGELVASRGRFSATRESFTW